MALTVNNETLRRLAFEVGEEMVSSLLFVFSDELKGYYEQLSDAPTIMQIREISHAIKSSAASFGADELAELARECESRIILGQEAWAQEQLPQFVNVLQKTASHYFELAQKDIFDS